MLFGFARGISTSPVVAEAMGVGIEIMYTITAERVLTLIKERIRSTKFKSS